MEEKGVREWNRKETESKRERGMEDHSPIHDLPTLAHKIPSPHPTHEQSCPKILTRSDDHQARHRPWWQSNEEWKEWTESEGMKQKWDRIKEEEEEEEERRSLTLPWPSNTRSQDPVSTSHTRTVLSKDPDTTRRPSGKAQTLVTS
jgi:hypothetical protein